MDRIGLKYSLICLGTGLSLWYASPHYFYESKPHNVVIEAVQKRSLDAIVEDANRNALPFGLVTRPLTYIGLAGVIISAIAPKKKDS